MSAGTSAEVHLRDGSTGRSLVVRPRCVILAGYTGRDQEQVRRHIEELREQGIPAPDRTPETYSVDPHGLRVASGGPGHEGQSALQGGSDQGGRLAAGQGWSSGEVEFVLFETAEGLFVGVGSDHTDREIERMSFVDSKRAFPKIIAADVWPVATLASQWDQLSLRSWITAAGVRARYQESALGAILGPDALLALVPPEQRGDGLVLFSGTVPALVQAPREGACRFEGELLAADSRPLTQFAYDYEAGPKGTHV